jgi:hypothetical protein
MSCYVNNLGYFCCLTGVAIDVMSTNVTCRTFWCYPAPRCSPLLCVWNTAVICLFLSPISCEDYRYESAMSLNYRPKWRSVDWPVYLPTTLLYSSRSVLVLDRLMLQLIMWYPLYFLFCEVISGQCIVFVISLHIIRNHNAHGQWSHTLVVTPLEHTSDWQRQQQHVVMMPLSLHFFLLQGSVWNSYLIHHTFDALYKCGRVTQQILLQRKASVHVLHMYAVCCTRYLFLSSTSVLCMLSISTSCKGFITTLEMH